MTANADLKTFSKDLKELESLVNRMEHDNLDLDDALSQFEKGIALTQKCQKALDAAELKVKVLTEKLESDASKKD